MISGRVMMTLGALAASVPLGWAQHGEAGMRFDEAARQAGGLKLADGMRLTVWAMEPQLSNGVAFSFDPRGRAYIAETHRWNRSIFDITQKTNWLLADMAFRSVRDRVDFLEGQFAATDPGLLTRDSELVRRLEDVDGDGRVDSSTVFATGFNSPADGTAAGVLATGSRVYFGNIPSLWSFPAADVPPSRPVEPSSDHLLATGFGVHIGVSGHDLHGLIAGPDGRLYLSFGDRGLCVTNREGVLLNVPDCGGVLRCEPDGSGLEVFCIGLRNPQELAFDDLGNLWTVDNDTAGADPCRVLHLVEGGDYGWRTAYQHQSGFGEWVGLELWKGGQDGILPLAGTVSQGPSGLAYCPGNGFGPSLAGTFLHCDFPGGVWAFTVRASGASFLVDRKEKFLWGCWPTDVDFGPDGAVYVLDWVSGWGQPQKGRIYRITPGNVPAGASPSVAALLASDWGTADEGTLARHLGHADRRVRQAAQAEWVRRGEPQPLTRILATPGPRLARLHAAWALGQMTRRGGAGRLTSLLTAADDPDDHVAGAVLETLASAADPDIGAVLDSQSATGSPVRLASVIRARRILDRQSPAGPAGGEPWVGLPDNPVAQDPFVEHELVLLAAERARRPGGGALLDAWRNSPAAGTRKRAVLALRRLGSGALTNHLSDVDSTVQVAAGRAIHDAPVAAAMPALAALVTRIDCPTNLMTRVIDANLRLGTPVHAQMIASFAKRRDVPGWARARALEALGDWGSPPPLDPVTGLWRPAVTLAGPDRDAPSTPDPASARGGNPLLERARAAAVAASPGTRLTALPILPPDLGRSADFPTGTGVRRNPQGARRAFLRVGDEILNPDTPDEFGIRLPGAPPPAEVQLALLRAAVKMGAKEAAHPFFEKLKQDGTPAEVRREIVPALAALMAFQTGDAVRLALDDADAEVRSAALPYLDRLEGEGAATRLGAMLPASVPGTDAGRAEPPAPVVHAAFAALGRIGSPATDGLLTAALEALLAGRLAGEYHLDALEAAGSRSADAPAVAALLEQWRRSRPADDPLALRRPALAGGDPGRGADIFFNSPQVQCSRCHQAKGVGGIVGPALDGIGVRRSPEYLLEAIVDPNRTYPEGFVPPPGGLSAMPEGLADLLAPLELRDVLAYLRSLR